MNNFTDLLKNGMATAEASARLNQSEPKPRPYRNPDEEIMLWKLQSLHYDEQDKARAAMTNMFRTNTTILSSDIHSCKTQFEELKSIRLKEMKVPMVHKGRYLACQIVGIPFAIVGVNVLVQDLNGDVEEVALYNFSYKLDKLDWVYPGTILIIKEPWLRYGSQSKTASLRIDSPSDVIFVDPTDYDFLNKIGAKQLFVSMSKDAEVWRKMANESFKKEDYNAAMNLYDRAIRCNPELPVLYRNKSLTCLRTGAFYTAYEIAKDVLEKDDNREIVLFRMGEAAYGMHEWQKAADHFVEVLKEFPENELASGQLKRATARLAEQKNGKFDFKKMYLESRKEKAELDVADYKGPIEIANIPGKGRGIIASEDIKEGTLLAVSKAFASGYDDDYPGILVTINLMRKDMGTAAQMLQVIQAMQNLKNNPHRAKEVYDLYAGEDMHQNEEIPFGVIDAARIQQISACNRFASDDLSPDEKAELIKSGSLSGKRANSHLFILPSYFNHSCLANARRTFYGDVMVIHANEDIKKGDEIYLSYISPLYSFPERQKKLNSWHFTCHCKLCETDAKQYGVKLMR